MNTKFLFRRFFFTSLIGMIILLAVGIVPVCAQCEDPEPSSCASCHAQEDPVNEKGEWHIIHASKDICMNCHGGNGSAMDKDLAHESLTAHPLDDIYTDCHCCHTDYDARAARFAPPLGVTPGSCTTPTPVPAGNIPSDPPHDKIISTNLINTTPASQPIATIGEGLAILIIFFFGIGWLERHHVKSQPK
jgi:hypothetical protein